MASDVPDDGDPTPATDSSSTLPIPVPQSIRSDESTPATEPIEPRPYIEIRPSETTVDPTAVTRAMERLEALLADQTQTGVIHTIRGSTRVP